MTMSDRIAVMRAGRIEQLGAPEALYERPRTEFVAGFLGVSNLLDGRVTGRRDGMVEITLPDGTRLRAPSEGTGAEGEVRMGVRPEKLRVIAADAESAPAPEGLNAIAATILDASYIGVSTQYLVETADRVPMTVYAQNLETSGSAEALADGRRVILTWRPEHTFVIDERRSNEGESANLEEEATP